jgi:DNA-binding beta-propeller fold protein YncE
VIPDPDAPPRRSFWRALGDAIAGIDPRERSAEVLVRPFGIAIAPDGAVIVADPDAPGVLRVDADGALVPIACRGRDWGAPMAVVAGEGGSLLVADAGAAEIVVVPPDRRCRVLGAGALERPTGVAAASGGRVMVVDPPRHQVVVLSPGGEVVARFGRAGEGEGEFNFPTAIARAPDGTYVVVDALNFRVVRLAEDGRWLGTFGSAGTEGGGLGRPKGVAVDEAGRVYVSDAHRDLVLVFGAGGEFEYALGASGTDPGAFSLPAGVAVRGGRLLVADSHNRRIQAFEILGGSS